MAGTLVAGVKNLAQRTLFPLATVGLTNDLKSRMAVQTFAISIAGQTVLYWTLTWFERTAGVVQEEMTFHTVCAYFWTLAK